VELAPMPEDAVHKTFDVRVGDTLMKALLRAGSEPRDADAAIRALQDLFDPRKLRAGQTLTVSLAPSGGGDILQRLTIDIEPGRKIETGRVAEGGFAARVVEVALERMLVHTGGRIDSSLYLSAVDAGVPNPVLLELIRAFSFDIDFQREIQRGDRFEVMFERFLDDYDKPVREGNVLYAAMTLSGSKLTIYRYTARDGFADYYNEDGHSIRKALLRTPIDGARLTSGYGNRVHPTLGYTKMHRGVDFGAKRGTPIMAAGDGVIEFAARNGSYGKYVHIRHRGSYSTAYAHLDRIATGIQRTRRVKQGQIIGFVGSTGRSTGPHLHYEVLQAGKQINPLKVKLPTGAKLKGSALAAFEQSRLDLERQLAALPLVRNVSDAMAQAAAQAEACGEETAEADPAC
ncbi:MAG: peptidoglycan DD-metalloendopeptidase family protein, partial [Alphaproteobacteria bacterium]